MPLFVTIYFSLLCFGFSDYSSGQEKIDFPQILNNLPGLWASDGSVSFEKWDIASWGYTGVGFYVNSNDTIVTETLKIFRESEDIYYEATVMDQNDGKGVKFKLLKMGDNFALFQNKKHDYPQQIKYTFNGKNSLIVEIIGEIEGGLKSIQFKFSKQ
ncbi:MAG: DUF6265 family protein [Bacteroidales bacterium]|nr:DUF6265 family protein [Bacteroidales bacterium]MCF8404632.1 DUF6265 family protein [Bacteroidales bacterium]